MLAIDYNSYHAATPYGKRVRFLVLHYTMLDFAASAKVLATGAASTHYLTPAPYNSNYGVTGFRGQCIFNLIAEENRAWHAGVSGWVRRSNLNDISIGIEIVNFACGDSGVFTSPGHEHSQINVLKQLAKDVLWHCPDMAPKNMIDRSNITIGHKSNPGPRLPWKELYGVSIGAQYDDTTRDCYHEGFGRGSLPPRADLLEAFHLYGYTLPATVDDAYFTDLLRAFQMHFRPESYDGTLDMETAAILYALNEKYPA